MKPEPIDYASPAAHPKRWRPGLRHLLGGMVAISLAALPFIPVREVRSRVDAVSGSLEWQTEWPLGIKTAAVVEPSPLELRLRKMGFTWSREWRVLHYTGRTLFGNATSYACGSAPPVFQVRSGFFATTATEAEIREFVRVMQNGTEAEQREAVNAAILSGWHMTVTNGTGTPPQRAESLDKPIDEPVE